MHRRVDGMGQDYRRGDGRRRESAVSAIVRAGLAGAAGVWLLDRLDTYLYGLESEATRRRTTANRPEGADPATVLVRRAGRVVGHRPGGEGEKTAVAATHYAIGIVPAVLFGLLRRQARWIGAGLGIPFGAAFFAAEDEVVNTVARTAGPPAGYPWQAHARGLVAHVAFGVAVEALLRATDPR